MSLVNVGTVINKALAETTGRPPRSRFIGWFNRVVKDIMAQPRAWKFLAEPLSVTIANNQITIPAGISEIVSIQVGTIFFTPEDQLSQQEAAKVDNYRSEATGYTLSAEGVVTFHPSLVGIANLTGEILIDSDYVDNADTIFPVVPFENLFVQGILAPYYEM